ncbi:glycosyltransferase family 2 protein [Spirosoma sp. SC4-14]|uniref:glycosyltransferase family 2 protein n=1 Tax=Spirosoma sp. SC4-14 TaxID=3128900 RepID=UPI0030D2582C
MPKTYIIVLNYNGWRDTIACIESILHLDYKNYSIIIVDNNSLDNSVNNIIKYLEGDINPYMEDFILNDVPKTIIPKPVPYCYLSEDDVNGTGDVNNCKITIIKSNSNGGFSAGNNLGIKYALLRKDAEYMWLLNNDIIITPNSLSRLIEYHIAVNSNNKVGIVGAKLLYYGHSNTVQCLGGGIYNKYLGVSLQLYNGKFDRLNLPNMKIDYVSGACMLVSIDYINTVGLLSEDYFLYYEEIDWATRGRLKGYTIDYTDRVAIYHKEGATIGATSRNSQNRNIMAEYYYIRNKLIYTDKYYGFLPKLTVRIGLLLTIVRRVRYGQLNNAKTIWGILLGKR